ncbi:MAG: GNAT family N-acetyltransferase [Deltaproteobacteria bacterium]|nr:GNAT family N-acetyltransferase [Deltaproteobacteria bacterium]
MSLKTDNSELNPSALRRALAAVESGYALRPLQWSQEREVAALLMRAFADDPLVNAICNVQSRQRDRQLYWSFRIAIRSHCLSPQPAWVMTDALSRPIGVALVSRPSMDLRGNPDTLFALRGLFHVGIAAARRGMHAARTIAAQAPHGPFTYLRTLGVDPQYQGRGLGSRLVDEVIRAAPTGWPLYLETAKETNLTFYARHGLSCIGEFECLGVRVWRLFRSARFAR